MRRPANRNQQAGIAIAFAVDDQTDFIFGVGSHMFIEQEGDRIEIFGRLRINPIVPFIAINQVMIFGGHYFGATSPVYAQHK